MSAPTRPPARPDAEDHRHALRVAVGLLLPGAVLLAVGRPELMVYAAFGSFAGMYGRGETGVPRLRHQGRAALFLTVGVAFGVALSELSAPGWVLVVVETAYATVGSVAADHLRLRPAGPFFFIFALGATATVPRALVAPAVGVAICAASAALAVLVGMVGTRGPRGPRPREPRSLPPGARVHAARYALAVGVGGGIGLCLGFDHANWAMAAAAVPLAAIDAGRPSEGEVRLVLTRAVHRTVGTLAGLAVTAALLAHGFGPSALAGLTILLVFPTELFMTRHYAVAIGFFTPLVMVMTELVDPTPPLQLLGYRGLDTLIGVAAGVAVAVLVRGRRSGG
ncbi:FUSC family protein [Tsukamurella sp. 8F]|nr:MULTISPECIES: FUSC family protein [unclassified Tsukamurella]MDF0530243.1 FUSC family protein [Tsukamurella sp. 8J]MDF0586560.1 FUSC family protein [Tsukamurella sp. 8F]